MDGTCLLCCSRSPRGRLESGVGRLHDPVPCLDGAEWSVVVCPRGRLSVHDRRWLVGWWYEHDLVLLGLVLVGMQTGGSLGCLLMRRCRVEPFAKKVMLGGEILTPSFVGEMVTAAEM